MHYRRQLLTASPTDEENRLELIRLLAANGKTDEAIQNLADTIADRNATRTLRWTAIWLAPEIVRNDPSIWASVRHRVRSLNASDTEMNTALEALSLSSTGRVDEAVKLVAAVETNVPNEYLSSLHAILERNRSAADALNSFTRSLIAAREANVIRSFGFVEDEPLEQIVALYLKQNQLRAALKVAERVVVFQSKNSPAQGDETGKQPQLNSVESYQTLSERWEQRQRASRAKLLARLSIAAEQIRDLNRAVELERLRLVFVDTLVERNATQARLDHLQELQTSMGRVRKASLVVDQRLVGGD
jgi:hypothetical protein